MKKWLFVLAGMWFAGVASAQDYRAVYNPYRNTTLSPYLNLLRGGSPAVNYYMSVVPGRELRDMPLTSQGTIPLDTPPSQPRIDEHGELLPLQPQTGHSPSFLFFGGYYSYNTPARTYFPLTPSRR
ncbi:MAG: hypothetical protein L0215_01055 [Gemmataceae bacterium]|nr:hypothetical protein [Gemmataceae bacterium]